MAALLRQDDTHGAWVCAAGDELLGHAIWGRALREVAGRGLTDVRLHVHPDNVRLARRLSRGATSAVLAGAWSRSPGRLPTCSTGW